MKDFYTWDLKIKISVHKDWVADGFNLNDEQTQEFILNALSERLPYANMETELDVETKIIKSPDPKKISKEQGFEN